MRISQVGDWSGRIIATYALAEANRRRGDTRQALSLVRGIWADWSSGSTDQRAHQHLGGQVQLELGSVYADLHR